MINRLWLAEIKTDGGTQSRAALNETTVADYREKLEEDEEKEFPPVIVFYDGANYWLADGFHRHAAYRQAGRSTIPVEVRQGTRRDAIFYSFGANASHGLPRSNEDKNRAVERMLQDPEWGSWTNRRIGRVCGVSHSFVNKLRNKLFGKEDGEVEGAEVETVSSAAPAKSGALQNFPESEAGRLSWIAQCSVWAEVNEVAAVPGLQKKVVEALNERRTVLELIGNSHNATNLVSIIEVGYLGEAPDGWPENPDQVLLDVVLERVEELALDHKDWPASTPTTSPWYSSNCPWDSGIFLIEAYCNRPDRALSWLEYSRGLNKNSKRALLEIACRRRLMETNSTGVLEAVLLKNQLPPALREELTEHLKALRAGDQAASPAPAEEKKLSEATEKRQKLQTAQELMENLLKKSEKIALSILPTLDELEEDTTLLLVQKKQKEWPELLRHAMKKYGYKLVQCPDPRCGWWNPRKLYGCGGCYRDWSGALREYEEDLQAAIKLVFLAGKLSSVSFSIPFGASARENTTLFLQNLSPEQADELQAGLKRGCKLWIGLGPPERLEDEDLEDEDLGDIEAAE